MAVQNNANIGFEKQIWDAACVLWGHIPAAEYRKVIVGLIFLRYISSAFEKRYQQLVDEGDGFEDDKDAYAEDNIFFVPEDLCSCVGRLKGITGYFKNLLCPDLFIQSVTDRLCSGIHPNRSVCQYISVLIHGNG